MDRIYAWLFLKQSLSKVQLILAKGFSLAMPVRYDQI